MKIRRMLGALALALLVFGMRPAPAGAVTRISASVDFYDELSPYGSWERVSLYGDCWVPARVNRGWRPYTVGYWVDTDYGWMWVSQDPWGDVPYHYGRWAYDSYYGWVWVPDDDMVWATSWCAWRYGDDYVGWAPLPPDAGWGGSGLTIDVSILDRRINRTGWCFTPVRSFGTQNVRYSILPPTRNVTIFSRTRNVTRYESYRGMPAVRALPSQELQRTTGRRFQRYQIADSRSQSRWARPAIRGRTIEVYRPTVTGVRRERSKFVPTGKGGSRGRQGVEQRRNDQTTRQERGVMQRDQGRDARQRAQEQGRGAEMRRQQQTEMRAQQQRDASQRRRSQEQQRQQQNERRRGGQGQDQGQAPDQGHQRQRSDRGRGQKQQPDQGQGQTPDQGQQRQRPDRGRGQQQQPDQKQQPDQRQDRGKGQGKNKDQSQDQSQDQGQGQSQDQNDQDKNRGRGHGH